MPFLNVKSTNAFLYTDTETESCILYILLQKLHYVDILICCSCLLNQIMRLIHPIKGDPFLPCLHIPYKASVTLIFTLVFCLICYIRFFLMQNLPVFLFNIPLSIWNISASLYIFLCCFKVSFTFQGLGKDVSQNLEKVIATNL